MNDNVQEPPNLKYILGRACTTLRSITKFYSYSQHSGVSLSEYHTTFKTFLHVMKEVKAKLPSNEEIAAAFTNGLNDEYFGEEFLITPIS